MKKFAALLFTLALLLCLSVPARAEGELPEKVILLSDDGQAQGFSDTLQEMEILANDSDLGFSFRQGPIRSSIDAICVMALTVYDEARAQSVYGAFADRPFPLIRLTVTVENGSQKAARFPCGDWWLLTSAGEIVQARPAPSGPDDELPEALAPGETASCYVFFSCAESWPDALSFFSLIAPEPWEVGGGSWGGPVGTCFVLNLNT